MGNEQCYANCCGIYKEENESTIFNQKNTKFEAYTSGGIFSETSRSSRV